MSENMSGCILNISQNIVNKTNGCLFLFSQKIENKISGCLLSIKQNQLKKIHNFQFSQNAINTKPFNLVVYIKNQQINPCELLDNISIMFAENVSATAELTLLAKCAEIDFYQYAGQCIEIYYVSENSNKKIFSGFINTPEIDFYTKQIKMKCTNEKTSKINNLDWNVINSIGFYSEKMFPNLETKEDIFNKRLESVPKSYYFDNDGIFHLIDWLPENNTNANIFSYKENGRQCDFLDNSLKVTALKTNQIVNKVNLLFQFQYNRKMQRDLQQSYNSGMGQSTTGVEFFRFVQKYHFIPAPPVSSVVAAVKGAGWVVGGFDYTGLPPEANYQGWHWSPAGYQWYYATSASWVISKRWVQQVQENYKITIKNQDSIDLLGEKSEELTLSFKIDDNGENWTDYKCYAPPPSGKVGNGDSHVELSPNETQNYIQAFDYALNVAKTKIYQSHRQNELRLTVRFNPDLNLGDTIKIDSERFSGLAVVSEITQNFDFSQRIAKTEFGAKWVKNFSGSLNNLEIPNRSPLPVAQYANNQMVFGNMITKSYSTDKKEDDLFNFCTNESEDGLYGYVMNEFIADPTTTTVGKISAVKFAIKTPDIEKESTDAIQVEKTVEYDLAVNGFDPILNIFCR